MNRVWLRRLALTVLAGIAGLGINAMAVGTATPMLVNDILDFSKIEMRRLELEAIPFSTRDHVAEVVKPLAMRAEQRGSRSSVTCSPTCPASWSAIRDGCAR